jgi:hypothetical protein
MNLGFLQSPAVILVFFTASILIVSWDWRLGVFSLAVQYIGVFLLVTESWPIEMAVVKLVAGWIAGAVLGLAMVNIPRGLSNENPRILSNVIFRILAAILAGLFAFTGGTKLVSGFPELTLDQAHGSMMLIALGLLHLGLTTQPFRVILGLLTALSGFEIIYSAVESSILVAGILATVTLGLAVIGAYLLTAPTLEESI